MDDKRDARDMDVLTEEIRLKTIALRAEVAELAKISPLRNCAPATMKISPSRGGVSQRPKLPVTR